MATIDGILHKLTRAHEHLRIFDKEVRAFLKGHPFRLDSELQPKGKDEYELIVKLVITCYPSSTISILAGEVVYQARSALDHLAYQLALAHVGLNANLERCEFPIFTDRSKFSSVNTRGMPNRGSGHEKIKDIAPAAQAIIGGLQPYCSGHDASTHPLWLLHELCNIDKHRRLQLIGVPIGRISTIQDGTFEMSNVKICPSRPLKDGAELMRATVSPRSNFRRVRVRQEVPPHVAFEEDITLPERYAGEILEDILTFIKQSVLPPLKPFLP